MDHGPPRLELLGEGVVASLALAIRRLELLLDENLLEGNLAAGPSAGEPVVARGVLLGVILRAEFVSISSTHGTSRREKMRKKKWFDGGVFWK